ncbi:sigma-54 dependent transcriptional regulator [Neisseriaceae bacterium ESL0693]|nr:sigma-54 dependent transcriptional regulator [Neisseriaceae bacterium ESL0693]
MPSQTDLKQPVLVIDDEVDIRDLMELTLMKMGLSVQTVSGVAEAHKALARKKFSLVLTDMRMLDGTGLDVVNYITEHHLDVPVAVITAYGNAEQAVQALKNGAFDYLQKPISLAQLRTLVKSAIKVNDHSSEVRPAVVNEVEEVADTTATEETIVVYQETESAASERLLGTSGAIAEVRELITRVARTEAPVYISGESGSGKEQAARFIHEASLRANHPFVMVNCGAIPEALIERAFFGYKKGSFADADHDRDGFFQCAHGGTLFLDEVADLPLSMQVKLLRTLQERSVRRLGEIEEKYIDMRLICATHKNLAALVESGQFRQDLFYRLNVVSVVMPPLRELREDLPQFIRILLQRITRGQPYRLSAPARQALLQYSYPGNFRELENILERAVALCRDQLIEESDLQIHSHQFSVPHAPVEEAAVTRDNTEPLFELGRTQIQDYLDEIEAGLLKCALTHTHYNRTQAAKLLGISFRSMRYRMERLGIMERLNTEHE